MTGPVPVRDDLVDVEPYGAPQLDVPVRLNTNETPWPPPAAYMDAVAERIRGLELNRYPDRTAARLRALLAKRHGLDPSAVWAANGSNEVLQQLFAAYGGPGRRLLLVRPGYSAHPLIARVTGTPVVEVDLDADFRLTGDVVDAIAAADPDIVCVASPNNPTGIPVAPDVVRQLHDRTRGLLVLDEAYVELADDDATAAPLLDDCDRLVVVRTFSKAWRMAGLRLGYLLAHDWVVDDLRKVRLPYHLDQLTLAAGELGLEMADAVTAHLEDLKAGRAVLHEALAAMPGVERVWPSAGNFLLFRVADPAAVFAGLLDRGVLVRDFSTAPRLEGCLRVSVGTPEENAAFLAGLRELLGG